MTNQEIQEKLAIISNHLETIYDSLTNTGIEALKLLCLQAGKEGLTYEDAYEWFAEIGLAPEVEDWWEMLSEEYPSNEDGPYYGDIIWHPDS